MEASIINHTQNLNPHKQSSQETSAEIKHIFYGPKKKKKNQKQIHPQQQNTSFGAHALRHNSQHTSPRQATNANTQTRAHTRHK